MSSMIRTATTVVLLASLAGCSGDDGGDPVALGPEQGVATLSLATPRPDDGALLFTLSGAIIGDPEPVRGDMLVFTTPGDGGALRVAVFGSNLTGPLLRVTVPGISQVGGYGLTIEEVAGPRNRLREDLTGYRLTLAP